MGILFRGLAAVLSRLNFLKSGLTVQIMLWLSLAVPFVVKGILAVLGVALVTVTVFEPLIAELKSYVVSNLSGAGIFAEYLGILRVDQFVSIVFSAATIRGAVGAVRVIRSARTRSIIEA